MEKENRREFLKHAAEAGATLALASAGASAVFGADDNADNNTDVDSKKYGIIMANLPYEENALEPFISEKTVNLHYHRHQQEYYNLLKGWIHSHSEYQNQTVEELIRVNHGGILLDESVFDLAVLLFNHNAYWPSLSPSAGGTPHGRIGSMIDASYGSYQAFRKAFTEESLKLGIGYLWVVADKDKVLVYRTDYHDTPLLKGYKPLLAVDMWEHAYYLDYQNDRRAYVNAVLDHLLNWDHAEKLLG